MKRYVVKATAIRKDFNNDVYVAWHGGITTEIETAELFSVFASAHAAMIKIASNDMHGVKDSYHEWEAVEVNVKIEEA